jgi:hypothetical protein
MATTLILDDEKTALLVSLVQGEICEMEQQISDYNGSLSNMVTKEEMQEYLASLESLLKTIERA